MEYYDIDSNRIFKDLNTINQNTERNILKILRYPSVLEKLYLINQYGVVVNQVANTLLLPAMDEQGYPCYNLSSSIIRNDKKVFANEKIRVVDLVAYNFIRNSESYLERGYIASNKNKILTDNYYTNIVYYQNENLF